MIRWLASMPYTVLAGLLIGLLIAPVGQTWMSSVLSSYDEARPVVRAKASIAGRDGSEVLLALDFVKHRDCQYLRLQAYAQTLDGELSDAYIQRVDRPEAGTSKPIGSFGGSIWRVWPVTGAASVVVYAQHNCGGRLVQTRLAEVPL